MFNLKNLSKLKINQKGGNISNINKLNKIIDIFNSIKKVSISERDFNLILLTHNYKKSSNSSGFSWQKRLIKRYIQIFSDEDIEKMFSFFGYYKTNRTWFKIGLNSGKYIYHFPYFKPLSISSKMQPDDVLTKIFKLLDKNNDGSLSQDELDLLKILGLDFFSQVGGGKTKIIESPFDLNKDGKIDIDEFKNASQNIFPNVNFENILKNLEKKIEENNKEAARNAEKKAAARKGEKIRIAKEQLRLAEEKTRREEAARLADKKKREEDLKLAEELKKKQELLKKKLNEPTSLFDTIKKIADDKIDETQLAAKREKERLDKLAEVKRKQLEAIRLDEQKRQQEAETIKAEQKKQQEVEQKRQQEAEQKRQQEAEQKIKQDEVEKLKKKKAELYKKLQKKKKSKKNKKGGKSKKLSIKERLARAKALVAEGKSNI